MQILMPIASHSAFFPKEEYYFPKPLIDIADRPMIDPVIAALKQQFLDVRFTFVALCEDLRNFSLDRTLSILGGEGSQVVAKLNETAGGLCSCLLAIDHIDHDEPLIICNSDQIIDAPLQRYINQFEKMGKEAGVLTFRSVHPRWSYVLTEGEDVIQTKEKTVVSDQAIAGFYYFRRAGLFFEAAKQVVLDSVQVDGTYYISSAINQVLLQNKPVGFVQFEGHRYHSFYSPERVAEFNDSPYARRLTGKVRTNTGQGLSTGSVNVIIPAAGEGSRFAKAGWRKKKPFIEVNGRTMLENVIENVSTPADQTTLLLRKEHIVSHAQQVKALRGQDVTIVPVDQLTEGTACTVLLARKVFDDDRPMMVANSDQLVDFDVQDFYRDCFERGLDGSILVFRDPTKNPKWSFAKVDENGFVQEVAEKKPISDLATVGIYLFRRGSDFVGAAVDMIARNIRVNDEFYTCPVYNHMIENGLRIGVYEVPMEAMKGLGTPEDLTEYLEDIGAEPSIDRPDTVEA